MFVGEPILYHCKFLNSFWSIFKLLFHYKTRGLHLFIEWGITDSLDFREGEGEKIGKRAGSRSNQVNYLLNPSIPFGIK